MNYTPSPSSNGANGRQGGGRFAQGNAGGPGNPYAKRVAELRAALFDAVRPHDLQAVISALLAQAKAGDVPSMKELLQRLLGPPESADLMERLEALETKIAQLAEQSAHSWRH